MVGVLNSRAAVVTRARMARKTTVAAIAGLVLATLSSQPAFARDQSGTVTKVAFAGGRFLFWVSGGKTGPALGCDCCARWEMPVSDANSQARMSLILTAYAQAKPVVISGTASCVAGANDTEGVSYFEVL